MSTRASLAIATAVTGSALALTLAPTTHADPLGLITSTAFGKPAVTERVDQPRIPPPHCNQPLPDIACIEAQQGPGQQHPGPQSPPAPKQGPTVSANPGLTGVTFHVTDRSGVTSQCTYSSEGYQAGFGLPANGSFDLFVPAIREFRSRSGSISCDNGTSTNTSVFY